jgi:hypothetical protein
MSETPQHRPTPPPHGRSVRDAAHGLALAFAALALFGLAAGAWYWRHGGGGAEPAPHRGSSPPEDPRTAYAGPFLNVAPDVRYVGSAACADCHDRQSSSYRLHPMGRSMFPVSAADPAPPEDREHNNPFEALGSQFRVERGGDTVRHRRATFDGAGRPVYDFALEASYAIGSGAHGHSYLTLREGGYVFQSPISWYAEKRTWDLSPGFSEALAPGRPVSAECLYCHANHTEPVEGTLNRYKEPVFDGPAIGCERCHGPGEKHVAARRDGKPPDGVFDPTIVNPAHLDPPLREAVCEQCHLSGEARVLHRGRNFNDFRPGLSLGAVATVLVRFSESGRDNKAVNHVEQMHASRCFAESAPANRLGCVSCHDPHVHVVEPAERVAHYRAGCLACHENHGCSVRREDRLKESPQDSCIDCHMPHNSLSNIPHTAGTDHRIVRFRRADDVPGPGPLPGGGGIPVVPFHVPIPIPTNSDTERDVGVGLMGPLTDTGKVDPVVYANVALSVLETAVVRDPEDWDAWEAKARALWARGRPGEALASLELVLAKEPRREGALAAAGALAQELGQRDLAIDYWRRAVQVNPWRAIYRQPLCALLAQKGAWEELRPHAEAWLRLDPASSEGRQTWIVYLLRTGRKDEARGAFEKLRALRPENVDKLSDWYEKESN